MLWTGGSGGVLDLTFTVDEADALDQLGEPAPALWQSRKTMVNAVFRDRQPLGLDGAQPNRCEGAFDGIRGPYVLPMLGREVSSPAVNQQIFAPFDD